ncbi:MAG: DNA cytosine methyltransferase [Acetobacteraceae bacterium]|nr:DNA cytosine methyltransferase [Acetobacteraceae bacterium]
MNELALFAGAGGGILGGALLGWRTVCAVEIDPYAAGVLVARQNEGLLPPFPIWDDVRTFDGRPWRGAVDVVSGGFPCQDISIAGKGAGISGARSGLWSDMARIIGEVRPPFAFVENSPALLIRGFERVLGDLAALGYDCRWTVLGAADVGAPHQRDRLWLAARDASRHGTRALGRLPQGSPAEHPGTFPDAGRFPVRDDHRGDGPGGSQPDGGLELPLEHTDGAQRAGDGRAFGAWTENADACGAGWWSVEPDVGRVADGVAARMDRLRAIGNGQVPLCAATAWRHLAAGFLDTGT